jgi:creatinine amidohydrolase
VYYGSYDGHNRKLFFQEMWRHELEAARERNPVVIVPVGSIEQHGPHCPPDVDISIPFHLAVAAAQAIDDFPVIVAPPVSYGFTHYNMGFAGTITLGLETFIAVLCDVCRSLKANGFERIVLLNGHGGNVAPQRAAAVKLAEEDVWALPLTYWDMAADELVAWSERDEGSIGHGGEWETSLQLYLRPQLIDRSKILPADHPEGYGWPRTTGRFSPRLARFAQWPERQREAPLGVMGEPRVASAAKGERLFGALAERLIDVCREFHDQELRRYRQFGSSCDWPLGAGFDPRSEELAARANGGAR